MLYSTHDVPSQVSLNLITREGVEAGLEGGEGWHRKRRGKESEKRRRMGDGILSNRNVGGGGRGGDYGGEIMLGCEGQDEF